MWQMFDLDEVLSALLDGEFDLNVHSETEDVNPPLLDKKESASFFDIIVRFYIVYYLFRALTGVKVLRAGLFSFEIISRL